jgi:2-(3-amino-3-carboxypropyl)histidine synthase
MEYDLELEKVTREIIKAKAKKVLIQLPDGLKPEATRITKYLKEKTRAEIFIWLGSCFGACDTPNLNGFDLLIQWGHSKNGKR